MLLKTILMLCLLGQHAGGAGNCLPPKDQKTPSKKRDATERSLVLAKIGERQASRILHLSYAVQPLEAVPLPKRPTPNEILDLHDCAWSQLLDKLFDWKPQRPEDSDAIQEMLRRAKHAQNNLNEFQRSGMGFDSRTRKSMQRIQEVKERSLTLSK